MERLTNEVIYKKVGTHDLFEIKKRFRVKHLLNLEIRYLKCKHIRKTQAVHIMQCPTCPKCNLQTVKTLNARYSKQLEITCVSLKRTGVKGNRVCEVTFTCNNCGSLDTRIRQSLNRTLASGTSIRCSHCI